MNEGQGQDDVTKAEDDWMHWVSCGDYKQMKAAGRQAYLL